MLTNRDVAEIVGKNQVLAATWRVQGGFIFPCSDRTMKINSRDGVLLRDATNRTLFQLDMQGKITGSAIEIRENTYKDFTGYMTIGTPFVEGYSPTFDVNAFFWDNVQTTGNRINTLVLTRQKRGISSGSIHGLASYLALAHPSGENVSLVLTLTADAEHNAAGTVTDMRGVHSAVGIGANGTGTVTKACGYTSAFFKMGSASWTTAIGLEVMEIPSSVINKYPIYTTNGKFRIGNEDFQSGGNDRAGYLYVNSDGNLCFLSYLGSLRTLAYA